MCKSISLLITIKCKIQNDSFDYKCVIRFKHDFILKTNNNGQNVNITRDYVSNITKLVSTRNNQFLNKNLPSDKSKV